MLAETIDQLSKDARDDDTIVAEPGEQMEWLCRQLIAHPTRIDERYTTNQQFLMCSAARTIAHQHDEIERLKALLVGSTNQAA